MIKKYLTKIIAKSNKDLQIISACCENAKIKASEIKYLKNNKIFLLLMKRIKNETNQNTQKIYSICKFEFVENVGSKNINQKDKGLMLELLAINLLKKNEKFEINIIFSNNAYITLSTEIIEVTLEDQGE